MDSSPIISGRLPLELPKTNGVEVNKAAEGFGEILKATVDQTNAVVIKGDEAVKSFHAGQAKNLHEVMIATEEADIAIRMLVQMRNKALEAYNEIMRLQI